MKIKTTTGLIKVKEHLIDKQTGEITIKENIELRDKNFYKFWLQNFMSYINSEFQISHQVFFLLIEKMDKHNKLNMTIDELSKKIKINKRTLYRELNELKRFNLIRKIKNGTYMINPDVIYQSTSENRNIAVLEYNNLKEPKALIKEKERQKKIKETKSKLKKMTGEELTNLLTTNELNDSVFDLIATTIVDNNNNGDENNE